jgi:hypothetical protein
VKDAASPMGTRDCPETFDFDPDAKFHDLESEVLLATETNKYRKFVLKLYGNEIFFYGKHNVNQHEFMHTLVGTFISLTTGIEFEGKQLYPVKISLPPKYTRIIYFDTTEE